VIAVHDQGYAEVSIEGLKTAGGFVLQPWGRVEGRLVLDSQPVANERIIAHQEVARYAATGQRFNFMTFRVEAETDSAGRFFFDKVPPGRCEVYWQASRGSRAGLVSHETSTTVNAGEVTEVLLGGTGRAVVGTAFLSRAHGKIEWQSVPVYLRLKTASEPGPRPQRMSFAATQAYIEATDHFFESHRAQRRFGAFCDGDGSFRLRDIPAGTYQLEIKIREPKGDSVAPGEAPGPETAFASCSREIIVPESAEGREAEALDLGRLELVPQQERTVLPR
jgi:hypothetical protein